MNQRLSEILNEIENLIHRISELQTEERTIIQTSALKEKVPAVLLEFNDAIQTIGWNGHLLRLAKKSYLLVKTLWASKGHRATIMKLENCVWKGRTRTRKCFIERHAICSMINRTRKKLEEAAFPYKIKTLKTKIKKRAKPQIKGWQLVCAQRTKKY